MSDLERGAMRTRLRGIHPGLTTRMARPFSRLLMFSCCLATFAFPARAPASELVIGRDAVQALVLASIFKDEGKWYLAKGPCYAYLERPRTTLAGGRLIIDGHLSSRMGLKVGDACVGTGFASDVQLSGRFIGAGSQISINEIRIDDVKDESTRRAIEVLQSAGVSLPKAVNIDLLPLLKPAVVAGTAIRVAVTKLEIAAVTTQADRVTVDFEMKLNAR
jgi:hypothetical protein